MEFRSTCEKIVSRILSPLKLKAKHEQTIISLSKKEKEVKTELIGIASTIESNDKLVKELVRIIQTELSTKLKATVKVSL